MRKTFGFLAIAGIVAVAVAQGTGGSLLSAFAQKLNSANSVSSDYTIQVIGSGGAEAYSVSLKKPNLARINTPSQLIVADGKTITTLDKSANTYLQKPESDADLKALFANDELGLFAGFFDVDAYKAAATKSAGTKVRKGQTVQAVQASVDPAGKKVITYFVAADGLAHALQFDFNDPNQKMTSILDTKSFNLEPALGADAFQFTPPADAKQITMDDLNSDKWYTNIQEAQQVAAKTNKLILVDFYADW